MWFPLSHVITCDSMWDRGRKTTRKASATWLKNYTNLIFVNNKKTRLLLMILKVPVSQYLTTLIRSESIPIPVEELTNKENHSKSLKDYKVDKD